MIEENLKLIRQNMEKAARKAGRNPAAIRLIAVTKEADISQIKEAVGLGIKEIGENRVKDALVKFRSIGNSVVWHLIGHLQTNKVKDAVKIFQLMHSLDSDKLTHAIDREAARIGKIQDVLIEVNVSGEKTKFGVSPEDLISFAEELSRFQNIRVLGLMAMAPLVKDAEEARPYYKKLKELALGLERQDIASIKMEHLSMGMTQDYEVAVEEGATMVRVGRAIFG